MEHGRSHDERIHKAERPRASNVPPDEEAALEAELASSGRHGMRPREGLVGAHRERSRHSTLQGDEGSVVLGAGSEVAPTKRAEERERERHRIERELGRVAAGTVGRTRDERSSGLSREDLERAAAEADRRVAGHSMARGGG